MVELVGSASMDEPRESNGVVVVPTPIDSSRPDKKEPPLLSLYPRVNLVEVSAIDSNLSITPIDSSLDIFFFFFLGPKMGKGWVREKC